MSHVHCKPPLILFILSYFILRWQLHKLLPCKPHNPPTLTINYDHLLFTRPALFIPPFFLGSILTSLCYINPQNLRSSQYLVRKFISNQYFHKPFVPYTNPKFHELYTCSLSATERLPLVASLPDAVPRQRVLRRPRRLAPHARIHHRVYFSKDVCLRV